MVRLRGGKGGKVRGGGGMHREAEVSRSRQQHCANMQPPLTASTPRYCSAAAIVLPDCQQSRANHSQLATLMHQAHCATASRQLCRLRRSDRRNARAQAAVLRLLLLPPPPAPTQAAAWACGAWTCCLVPACTPAAAAAPHSMQAQAPAGQAGAAAAAAARPACTAGATRAAGTAAPWAQAQPPRAAPPPSQPLPLIRAECLLPPPPQQLPQEPPPRTLQRRWVQRGRRSQRRTATAAAATHRLAATPSPAPLRWALVAASLRPPCVAGLLVPMAASMLQAAARRVAAAGTVAAAAVAAGPPRRTSRGPAAVALAAMPAAAAAAVPPSLMVRPGLQGGSVPAGQQGQLPGQVQVQPGSLQGNRGPCLSPLLDQLPPRLCPLQQQQQQHLPRRRTRHLWQCPHSRLNHQALPFPHTCPGLPPTLLRSPLPLPLPLRQPLPAAPPPAQQRTALLQLVGRTWSTAVTAVAAPASTLRRSSPTPHPRTDNMCHSCTRFRFLLRRVLDAKCVHLLPRALQLWCCTHIFFKYCLLFKL